MEYPHVELGNPEGEVVVMLSGLPDDCLSAWDIHFLQKMKAKYRLFCFCMPDYDKTKGYKKWGYEFEEIIDCLHNKMRRLLVSDKKDGGVSFYLVGHDWGSTVAQYYENKYPTDVKKLVLLDVS
jgi:pimeloyl-ACP methyl ester carboxylesterase